MSVMEPEQIWFNADPPSRTTSHAPVKSSCLSKLGRHADDSCLVGLRLSGGLQANVLSMTQSDLLLPVDSMMESKRRPERPTNGIPCSSSCFPGASPTNAIDRGRSLSNGTVWIRFSCKPQSLHDAMSSRIFKALCFRMKWRRDSGDLEFFAACNHFMSVIEFFNRSEPCSRVQIAGVVQCRVPQLFLLHLMSVLPSDNIKSCVFNSPHEYESPIRRIVSMNH